MITVTNLKNEEKPPMGRIFKMKILVVGFLTFISLSAVLAEDCNLPAKSLVFHKDFDRSERKTINDDLEWLRAQKLSTKNLKTAQNILNVPFKTGSDLHAWLLTRVRRLTYSLSELEINPQTIQENVIYPFADVEATVLEKPWGSGVNLPRQGPDRVRNYATNYSAVQYTDAKYYRELFQLDTIPGLGKVMINSPRTGIVNIDFTFFTDPNYYGHKVLQDSLALRIFRLSVLFHEARHSDGHGESLSFPHSVCPKGHHFEGLTSCDDTENGSYSVGHAVMNVLMDSNLEKLDTTEKAFLNANLTQWKNRLHPSRGSAQLRKLNDKPEILKNDC
jgi:hypothetical protein